MTDQDADDRVVIRIPRIIGNALNQAEQVGDEVVAYVCQVFPPQGHSPGHLIGQLQQQLVQPIAVRVARADEIQKSRKAPLSYHLLKYGWSQAILLFGSNIRFQIGAAVEEEEGGNGVERGRVILLEETMYDLHAHVIAVDGKELAREQAGGALDHGSLRVVRVVAVPT